MLRILLFVLLLLLAVLMVGAVVAYNLWGIWGLLGWFVLVVLGFWFLRLFVGAFAKELLLWPFRVKGKVLRDAILVVHEVRMAPRPDRTEEYKTMDSEDFGDPEDAREYRREMAEQRREQERIDAGRRWYFIDLTITPVTRANQEFTHWEPGDLRVVSADPKVKLNPTENDEIGEIVEVLVWDPQQQEFTDDEIGKYVGPQRLRIHVGIDPEHQRLAFGYYFEKVGDVPLPTRPLGLPHGGGPGS